ncbi:fumarylacetoacetate hydrolase family protein [Kineobactrum salinum]|uniref:Fumarylacetoacetate hydrolase family protein n=1 Tax=Kineobactrum salinum TaxID=2708301 RepID=A0A6C0TWG0_9GAMM|nr:fumarylacetoacetate hydrolase family protein [Kineobactrum salinum]QIB64111.1 fumarylacetoacetate hydrolase family protein [Kineobactrum salinum]
MKWLSFELDGARLYGFVKGDHVVNIRAVAARLNLEDFPRTLLQLVEAGDGESGRLKEIVDNVELEDCVPLSDIEWRTPIDRPSKILGVPINNGSFAPLAHRMFEAPCFFMKPPSALAGHKQPLRLRAEYGLTHHEPELAAIIGKRARDISESEALSHVFGFTIMNDITSPSLKDEDSIALDVPQIKGQNIPWRNQAESGDDTIYLTYHTRSKGCDSFALVGPWIVTRDEISNPNSLAINAWIGSEHVTSDSTANLTFSIEKVIATASKSMTLEPGDIIHFGMAAVPTMPEKYPTVRSLDLQKMGGPIAVEIEGIGKLENPVVKE